MRSRILGVALAIVFLVGCQSPQGVGPQGTTPAGTAGAAPTGRTGGTIVWAKAGEVTGLDFTVRAQYVTGHVVSRVYEQLVTLSEDGKIVPQLATSWETPDPTTYVFKLRKGVKFHNGREMVASDVVTTFQRLIDPKTAAQYATRFPISSVTANDDYTVTFKLSKPYGPFLPHMVIPTASILPGKELLAGTFDINKDLVGTGPWMLEQHLQNESWTFKANSNYWQPGVPKADKLVILILNDDAARLAALREGRANVATFDGVDAARLLKDVPNVKAVAQETSDFNQLLISANRANSQLANDRVRQAISLAIDRDRILQLAQAGAGSPTTGTVRQLPDSCDPAKLPRRDVAKAKELLAAAGTPNPTFSFISVAGYGLEPLAEVIQGSLKEAGITVNITSIEIGAWSPKVRAGDYELSMSFDSTFVDNWAGLSGFSGTFSTFRAATLKKDPQLDEMLTQAAGLPPGTQRQQLFQKICDHTANTANILALTTRVGVVAYRTDKLQANIWAFEPAGSPIRMIDQYRVLSQ